MCTRSLPITSPQPSSSASFFLNDVDLRFLPSTIYNNLISSSVLPSFSNRNIQIKTGASTSYVMRIPTKISNLLGIREEEDKVLNWAFEEGFSAIRIEKYDGETGRLLTQFLDGVTCSQVSFQDISTIEQSLALLYKLHTHKSYIWQTIFDPLKRFTVTVNVASEDGFFLPLEIHSIAESLTRFWNLIPHDIWNISPCHNDPSPGNFFFYQGKLFLHDWELSSLNDPAWDLTHLAVTAGVPFETILQHYQSLDPLIFTKMNFLDPFVRFQSLVWASLEMQMNSSNLIANQLYELFLPEIKSCIESDTFKTTIHQLTHKD